MKQAWVSDDIFNLEQLPKSVTLMGSGYIGLEFASIFRGFGCETTVMFRSSAPLPEMDLDLRETVQQQMEARGVRFVTGAHLQAWQDGQVLTNKGNWTSEAFVCAAGRVPNTADLGLEALGIELGRGGEVLVNELNQTSVPSIFAVGDCTGGTQLTPFAIAKGRALAERLFGQKDFRFDPQEIPTAVFTQPAAATVGLAQHQAEAKFPGDVEIYRTRFRPMKYTLPDQPEKIMMKLVVRKSDQRVLGCHMVGADAPEIIQALAVALTAKATKQDFDRTLAVHPTAAEEFVLLREPLKPTKETP